MGAQTVSRYVQLLRNNPNYAYLWVSRVISLLGDWFNTIVLSALVNDYSGGSGLAISLFLMARFAPALIIGPYAGVLVDRFDRKRLLIYADLLRTGIVLLYLLVLDAPDRLWLIYVLVVIQFTLSALFEPGQSALTPSLVRRKDLVLANTLGSITWSTMLAVGAIVGGVVAEVAGSEIALITDAVTFLVSALLITQIVVTPREQLGYDPAPSESVTRTKDDGGFWDGIRYLRNNPTIAAVALVKGGGSIGNVDTLLTVFATQIFVLGDEGKLSLGILYSAFGLGAFIGPLLLNRFHDDSVRQLRRLIVIGFILATLGWLLIGLAGSLVIVALALLVRGGGGSANWTYSSAILQKQVEDRYLGRVFSVDFAVFQLVTVISTVAHGGIIDLLGAEQINLIAYGTGIISLIPLVAWFVALPRIERHDLRLATGD
jgi:MFS family permease